MADGDIKIYAGQKNQTQKNVSGMVSAFEEMNFHRTNGNLKKAKALGEKLALLSPCVGEVGFGIDISEFPVKYRSQDIIYQMKVLLVFEAQALMQREIDCTLLSTTAINALHDKIENDSPQFFRNISDGAAFTFYGLALKKDKDVIENIGQAFAMLCSVQKNKDGFVTVGKTVWSKAEKIILQEIDKVDFINKE